MFGVAGNQKISLGLKSAFQKPIVHWVSLNFIESNVRLNPQSAGFKFFQELSHALLV